jgi:hypothetical protein
MYLVILDHMTIILALPDPGSHRLYACTNGRYDVLAICTFPPPLPPRNGSKDGFDAATAARVGALIAAPIDVVSMSFW